ncbi:MAG: 1-phosphofructokinase family hexose kinase [Clostridiales bacterium]|nr:1-phosphofructokinase family hexose kinase [Clostridiales bacterium]
MILSVCPNPSIDCTMELEQLAVGRLNRVNNKIVTYSGKALNSAIGVKRLGGDSFATGFMYENEGSLFASNLDKEGVKNTFVWNKGSVRTNYKIVDNKSMLTEINDKGEQVPLENQQRLLSLVETLSKNSSVVIMSGSLPLGVDDDYYQKLSSVVDKSAKIIVDTEGEKLIKALKHGVYMVKPNLRELEQIAGCSLSSREDMLKACYSLIDLGAENVLLSLGREGAILTDGKDNYFCKSANVAVNSTVGAGDSMIAAASLMIEQGAEKSEILRNAVSAGTASITTPGTNLFYRDKFEEIYGKVFVEKV